MNTLWAPWRMERIEQTGQRVGATEPVCPFEVPGTDATAKSHLLLFRDTTRLCLLNRYPYANGHLLVAPTRHIGCLTQLTPGELSAVMQLVQEATAILQQVLKPDGLNIGINLGPDAGAGIPDHLHIHIVPRWRGDHNFMTVVSEIRTIPEHIFITFDRLLPHFLRFLQHASSHQSR